MKNSRISISDQFNNHSFLNCFFSSLVCVQTKFQIVSISYPPMLTLTTSSPLHFFWSRPKLDEQQMYVKQSPTWPTLSFSFYSLRWCDTQRNANDCFRWMIRPGRTLEVTVGDNFVCEWEDEREEISWWLYRGLEPLRQHALSLWSFFGNFIRNHSPLLWAHFALTSSLFFACVCSTGWLGWEEITNIPNGLTSKKFRTRLKFKTPNNLSRFSLILNVLFLFENWIQ